jgi:predicted nuclease with TOPRIM domain
MAARTRKYVDPELKELAAEQARLEARIAATVGEPERLRRQFEEERATLPATEDFRDRVRRRAFEDLATRGKVRNEHKIQRRSLMLFILLVAATASLILWGLKLMAR